MSYINYITDDMILDLYRSGRSKKELVKMLTRTHENAQQALRRIERVLGAEQFRLAGKPVPKEWR